MTTLILTSTVNINPNIQYLFQKRSSDRIDVYLKSIRQWLEYTNFNIILVENSGYPFNELNLEKQLYKERFEVITYLEKEEPEASYLNTNISKGASEIFSIYYAYNHSNIIHNSFFIIKITARFFIPELESYLSNYNLNNYDCLTQNSRDRCEMVGSHYKYFSTIFDIHLDYNNNNINNDHIETIWKNRISSFNNILVCKEFTIETTQRGGLNMCFNTI
jgi:hypothetical protein